MLEKLTQKLIAGRDLTVPEAAEAALGLAAEGVVPEGDKVNFLAALAAKGETPAEIAGFAAAYRSIARDPGVGDWADRAIDIVGTGGDHNGGFNVSSLVTLVLACAGVPVMKHGNRGVTSKCGSADLMAALGLDLEAPPEKSRRALQELGFCFFFAPAYHPAFRHIAAARKALAARGQRTVFNLLGPLINPGRPAHALVGAFAPAVLPKLAGALAELGCKAGLVVHGAIESGRGIDELTTATDNHVRGFGTMAGIDRVWTPGDLGFPQAPFADLVGGEVATNVALTEAVLAGRGPAGLADTIIVNAAAGLWITGRTQGIRDGVHIAHEMLLGGAVAAKIAAMREFYRS